jgi:hypothetical protein
MVLDSWPSMLLLLLMGILFRWSLYLTLAEDVGSIDPRLLDTHRRWAMQKADHITTEHDRSTNPPPMMIELQIVPIGLQHCRSYRNKAWSLDKPAMMIKLQIVAMLLIRASRSSTSGEPRDVCMQGCMNACMHACTHACMPCIQTTRDWFMSIVCTENHGQEPEMD